MARTPKFPLLATIAGASPSSNLPKILIESGPIFNAPLVAADGQLHPLDVPHVDRAFAAGAEYGDVCRALIGHKPAFSAIVRTGNLPRLRQAAAELGRRLTIVSITESENPFGVRAGILVSRQVSYAEGEGPAGD